MTARPDGRAVALYGGSFDPPHVGHVAMAEHALARLGVAEVLVVPVFSHAFGKDLTPFHHRMKMAELAFGHLRSVAVLPIEAELPSPSRTLETLVELERRRPRDAFRLLIGADVLDETAQWHAWDDVVRRAPPLVVGRAGIARNGAPEPVLPDVSSSEVRAALRKGGPSRADALRRWVPETVGRYIESAHLYE